MRTQNIVKEIESGFSEKYANFKEFQYDAKYKAYWDKCLEAVSDRELLSHIVFCNDLFETPPVKTFLLYYKNDFILITGSSKATLDVFVKKSIGAFWGMAFRYVLGYTEKKSVSVSMFEYFGVRTATCFAKPGKKVA